MNASFWVILAANLSLATYSVNTICRAAQQDRRCPSPSRLAAIRAAYLFAVLVLGMAALLLIGAEGRRLAVVREWVHFGCLASSFCAALAIRILRGEGWRD